MTELCSHVWVLAVCGLVACDAGSEAGPSPSASVATTPGPRIPVPGTQDWPFAVFVEVEESRGSLGALLEGTLDMHDGCLVVVPPDPAGGDVTALMLDADYYAWDGEALVVGDETWRLGDEVHFGGGFMSRAGAEDFGLPESCPDVVLATI